MAPYVEEFAEESLAVTSKVAPNLVAPEPGEHAQNLEITTPTNSPQSIAQAPNPSELAKEMHVPAVQTNRFAPPRPKVPIPTFQSSPNDFLKSDTRS